VQLLFFLDLRLRARGNRDTVRDVLCVAEQNDLYFKLSKCTFHASSIDYLGVIIEKGMTRMDPVKIAGIKNWPIPTKVKDVCSFLGFCNFYRPFIRGFAHLARPLNELTCKDTEWTWEARHQKAFEELKTRVTTEPVLAHPILTDPFELEVDTSGFAMGAVLLQKKEDGKKHPIAYYSKTLSTAERNYDVYNLKLLAIVNALDHWRQYLAGSPHKIIIYSDHQNLLYWKEPHKISRRVAREVLMLSEYNFEIRHIKGTANGRADALSQRPDYDQGQEDNQNITVLPEQVFAKVMEVLPDLTSQEESTLKPWIDPHQLKQHQGTWYKDGRQVVTGDIEAKRYIIQSHHDSPVYGHPGISKTIQLTERLYWWPKMRQEITEYVKGCTECQRHKVNNRPTKAPYIQSILNRKLCLLKQWCLTSLLSCQYHKDLIPFSPLSTKVVRKRQSSFPAMKTSQQKKQQPSISNMCSLILAYQQKSSVIEIHGLCPNSCKQHVRSRG
jgi:hypothetical protein